MAFNTLYENGESSDRNMKKDKVNRQDAKKMPRRSREIISSRNRERLSHHTKVVSDEMFYSAKEKCMGKANPFLFFASAHCEKESLS